VYAKRLEPTLSMLYGTCFDEVVNKLILSINNPDIGIPDNDTIFEWWEACWNRNIDDHVIPDGKTDKDVQEMYDNGIQLSQRFVHEYAEYLEMSVSQPDLSFDLDGIKIVQRADIILGTTIIDMKTAARSPSKNKSTGEFEISPYHKVQLNSYVLGARSRGIEVDSIATIVGVRTKEPKIIPIFQDVRETELDFVRNLYKSVNNKVEAGAKDTSLLMPNRLV